MGMGTAMVMDMAMGIGMAQAIILKMKNPKNGRAFFHSYGRSEKYL